MENDLIDMGGYAEMSAHGLAEVNINGANAELIFFRWRKMQGAWRRVIAGVMFLPTDALASEYGLVSAALHALRSFPSH